MGPPRAVTACAAISNVVKSSLGPVGLDKMLVRPTRGMAGAGQGPAALQASDPIGPRLAAVLRGAAGRSNRRGHHHERWCHHFAAAGGRAPGSEGARAPHCASQPPAPAHVAAPRATALRPCSSGAGRACRPARPGGRRRHHVGGHPCQRVAAGAHRAGSADPFPRAPPRAPAHAAALAVSPAMPVLFSAETSLCAPRSTPPT